MRNPGSRLGLPTFDFSKSGENWLGFLGDASGLISPILNELNSSALFKY